LLRKLGKHNYLPVQLRGVFLSFCPYLDHLGQYLHLFLGHLPQEVQSYLFQA